MKLTWRSLAVYRRCPANSEFFRHAAYLLTLAQHRMKKEILKVIGTIVPVVAVLSFTALFVSWCGFALVPVRTRSAYQPILKYRWENKYIVEHFPAEIPDEAQDIKFYYRAGLMQGGTTIELRMQMPEREFDSIVQNHRAMAKLILDHLGKDNDTKSQEKVYFAPPLMFYTVSRAELTDEYQIGPLPADYEIFGINRQRYNSRAYKERFLLGKWWKRNR